MHVLATAGHVDHGKSTLVAALTGRDPDRLAEEKRRGLTIDLGYAWTTLDGPGGAEVLAFVDVPGHERFIATMLAGLGPAPGVVFVVAADEGWREQSAEHLAAVDALRLRQGLLVVTRADLADPAPALRQARAEIGRSSLGDVAAVAVSGRTGDGLDALRAALYALVRRLPARRLDGPVRLWIDRSFVIKGAGTVVTGTLDAGTLRAGDTLVVGDRAVTVRGLQSLEQQRSEVAAPARVAVNLRGVGADEAGRGDALCTPGQWSSYEIEIATGSVDYDLPGSLTAHLGTDAQPVRVRTLGRLRDGWAARLRLDRAWTVRPGDRVVLRDPGGSGAILGAEVLDVDPLALRRRGAARQRAASLEAMIDATPGEVLRDQVRARGAVRSAELARRGMDVSDRRLVVEVGDWLVDRDAWSSWRRTIAAAVERRSSEQPLEPRMPVDDLRRLIEAPDRSLVVAAAEGAGLLVLDGRVQADTSAGLGAAEEGLAQLVDHLQQHPFHAPERDDLAAWGLGPAELAAAERTGRIVRLTPDLVLLPTGPALALRTLAGLPQPFTTSQARQALGTTRRVAIPLLEHLDRRGWTRRVDGDHREVRRPSGAPDLP